MKSKIENETKGKKGSENNVKWKVKLKQNLNLNKKLN